MPWEQFVSDVNGRDRLRWMDHEKSGKQLDVDMCVGSRRVYTEPMV
jgi:hypothetical protein